MMVKLCEDLQKVLETHDVGSWPRLIAQGETATVAEKVVSAMSTILSAVVRTSPICPLEN